MSEVMLLLTLIILVILPVCANASPGATSEAEQQEARVFMCTVEKKQKSVVASKLKDELF